MGALALPKSNSCPCAPSLNSYDQSAYPVRSQQHGPLNLDERHRSSPQWTTSSRLLRLGEAIDFDFFLPDHAVSNDLVVFERYLERAEPGAAFSADGDLSWLDENRAPRAAPRGRRQPSFGDLPPDAAGQLSGAVACGRRDTLPLLRGHRGRLAGRALQHRRRAGPSPQSARDGNPARLPPARGPRRQDPHVLRWRVGPVRCTATRSSRHCWDTTASTATPSSPSCPTPPAWTWRSGPSTTAAC